LKTRIKFDSIFPTPNDIPDNHRFKTSIEQRDYLLNGTIRHWEGAAQDVFSPICIRTASGLEQVRIGSFPLMTEKDALAALDAAAAAYDKGRGLWPTMAASDRIKHIQGFAAAMKKQRNEVTHLLMWEIGKTLVESEKEFDRTTAYIADTVDAFKELDRISSRFVIEEGIIGQIRRASLGVTLSMGPYNYPLNETFTTLIPALIMGNTTILKPPRHGLLLFSFLLQAFHESFPPGVVNIIYGAGRATAPAIMRSGLVQALAFIGTSKAASALYKEHPKPHRLRLVLGMEAKNPAIVLPDADLDMAVKECVSGSLTFNGQRCTALKILFVHEDIVEPFLALFSKAISDIRRGMPWESGVMITPLPEHGKTAYLSGLVEDALKHGAKTINEGGGEVCKTFFNPALVYPVNKDMRLYSEEQFGPVVPVVPFTDTATPIHYIEESAYGQQVSIFGKDPQLLAAMIDPLVNQVSRVNINSQCQRGPDSFPFTGRKDSAVSTLSISDALRAFSIRTLVAARDIDLNREIINDIVRKRRSNFLSTDFIL
jgi:glyceraldehyde-3-phosphate dehydrogenase (NADP+)